MNPDTFLAAPQWTATRVARVALYTLSTVVVGSLVGGIASILMYSLWGLTRVGVVALTVPTFGHHYWTFNGAFYGAVLGPLLRFTLLRRVPLWQAIVVPLTCAVAAGLASLLIFSGEYPTWRNAVGIPTLGAAVGSLLLFVGPWWPLNDKGPDRAA
jgi:hypothetical protein